MSPPNTPKPPGSPPAPRPLNAAQVDALRDTAETEQDHARIDAANPGMERKPAPGPTTYTGADGQQHQQGKPGTLSQEEMRANFEQSPPAAKKPAPAGDRPPTVDKANGTPANPFKRAQSHIWIGSIDAKSEEHGKLTVKAQYNPATLEISQSIAWKKPEAATQGGGTAPASATAKPDENYMAQEYTGSDGRSMSIELLFDGFETGGKIPGADDGLTVLQMVGRLETLSRVKNPKSSVETDRRPHHCVVVWGASGGVLDRFTCVIESLTTKYTMFSSEGVPLRATCTVKLKEAASADKKKADAKPAKKKVK